MATTRETLAESIEPAKLFKSEWLVLLSVSIGFTLNLNDAVRLWLTASYGTAAGSNATKRVACNKKN